MYGFMPFDHSYSIEIIIRVKDVSAKMGHIAAAIKDQDTSAIESIG